MPHTPEPVPKFARHPFLRFWLGLFATIIVAGGAAPATAAILGVGELLSLRSRLPTPTPKTAAVGAIFAATYLVLAIGKLPYYRLDRAGGAPLTLVTIALGLWRLLGRARASAIRPLFPLQPPSQPVILLALVRSSELPTTLAALSRYLLTMRAGSRRP